MSEARPSIAQEIGRYLRTGDTDAYRAAWSGDIVERAHHARDALRGALVREVQRRAKGQSHSPLPEGDTVALTRRKVEPMVRGLFARTEQPAVLATLERSVVFLSSGSIERVLLGQDFDGSAWNLANLYLASVGAELLAEDAPSIVGLSEGTICYVSPEYFRVDDPFADFIVHEAAHIFHNCKRHTVGLRQTRTREWLLDIQFGKRETFAYSCEAYARVVERGRTRAEHCELAAEFARAVHVPDDRVDTAEVASIVQTAAAARNGWKAILARCSRVDAGSPERTRASDPAL